MITLISFIFVIIGALNWLLVGAFSWDLVAAIFGTAASVGSRIVYILVGLSALWLLIKAVLNSGRLNLTRDDIDGTVSSAMLHGSTKSKKSD